MNTTELELHVVVDAQGDWACGDTDEAARENYAEAIGGLDASNGFRMVKVRMSVPLPETAEIVVVCNAEPLGLPVQIDDRR